MFTKLDIIKQLTDLGAPRNSVVIMHSSLKSIGEVEGRGEAVLDAMIEYFAEEGLFCVPTHTWSNLATDKITLDMTLSDSNLGAFPCIALKDARGVRSENPTHSIVVFGDRENALSLIKAEPLATTPTSPIGALGELYRRGGYVLLVGVGQDKNTYLHFVDELLCTPGRMSNKPESVTIKKPSGEIIEREIYMYDESLGDISELFPKFEPAFAAHGCLTYGNIGAARACLCSAAGMKEVVELIYSRADCDPLRDKDTIPEEWYIK